MPANRTLRLVAVIGLSALVIGAGCTRGDDDPEVEVTEAPSPTASVEAVADFQTVGRIDEAFQGPQPDIDLPEDTTFGPDTTPSATGSPAPAATPVGSPAPVGGILRFEIEALSDGFRDACGVDTDDIVEIYWTTETFFEPATVVADRDDIEDAIENRTAGISGDVFRTSDADPLETAEPTVSPLGSPTVTTTPAGTAAPGADIVAETDCILVAEQIGFTQTRLPTPRPAVRTAAPTPVRTPTPTPVRTPTPLVTDEPTEEPTDPPDTDEPTSTP